MTQQDELRIVLRTIAEINGASQVRRALGDVQTQAQRITGNAGGIVLRTIGDTRGADAVRRALADVQAQTQRAGSGIVLRTVADTRGADQVRRVLTDIRAQAQSPAVVRVTADTRGADQVRRELANVRQEAQRTTGGIVLRTVADTRGAEQVRRSLVDVQAQAQRTANGIVLRTIADTRGSEQVRRSLADVQTQAQRTTGVAGGIGRGFDVSASSILRFAGALAGMNIGLSLFSSVGQAIRNTIEGAGDAFIDSERIARATAAAYGQAASSFTNFATVLSSQTGFTKTAILEAALSARTLSENYGLSIQQTQKLIAVSADLANVRGIGVAEAFERVQSAIRGEAEASEFLGLTLNATFLQQNAQNGALRQTFTTLTDVQRAQVVYGEVLRQTANFTGLAAKGNEGLEGAQKRAALASQEFSQDLGKLLSPALERGTTELTNMTLAARDLVRELAKLPGLPGFGPAPVPLAPNQLAPGAGPPPKPAPPQLPIVPLAPSIAVPKAPFQKQELIDISKALDEISGTSRGAVNNADDLRRAMDDITKVALPKGVAPKETLPGIIDAASQAADLSVARLIRDLDLLQDRSSAVSSLLAALSTGVQADGARAALQAAQDLLRVEAGITAQLGAQEARRKLIEQTRVSDPRDAPGARAAVAQLALFDQLEAANRDLLLVQNEQRDIQNEQRDLAIEEARQVQAMLPARQAIAALERQITDQVDQRLRLQQEAALITAQQRAAPAQNALEDTNAAVQRARLVLADRRNQSIEARQEARQTIRNATRNVLPGQELAAFDANQGISAVERQQRATDLSTRAAQNPLQQLLIAQQAALRPAEASLLLLQQQSDRLDQLARIGASQVDRQAEIRDAIIAAAIAAGKIAKEPVKVQLQIKDDQGNVILDQLIEATGEAQSPPVIKLSGAR